MTGFEPAASAPRTQRSTKLSYTPRCFFRRGTGFGARSSEWRVKDSNLRRRTPADLQSAPFGHLGNPPWWESRSVPIPLSVGKRCQRSRPSVPNCGHPRASRPKYPSRSSHGLVTRKELAKVLGTPESGRRLFSYPIGFDSTAPDARSISFRMIILDRCRRVGPRDLQ